jgi:hypothetical protein
LRGGTDWFLYSRHFAVIGALVALGLHIFGFFVHQLVAIKQGYFANPLNAQYPYGPMQESAIDAQQELQQLQNGSLTAVPPGLKIARLANATEYTYTDVGQAPSKPPESAHSFNPNLRPDKRRTCC